ncbi:Acg family FMN-binding oxidoreductase [Dactylosporangium sucinum]|uniref:NAD(P)H nitroreductase n=1 Tax=Dactylosporangium sucinum TaxID=1424081 RepID=A0A917WSS3_9ACTN|nr:nitroreductase family protein [Dactylosporangium sucinum]GGM25729.1 NAD(P)H nitroreductase [Dactylosporangium sucinum]
MAAIQFTDRGSAVNRTLTSAVLAALDAPSMLNTQPWQWRIAGDRAELRADRRRQLPALDPDGRLMTLSCGVALHHARVALGAAGAGVDVTHLPDADEPDLLAVLRYTGSVPKTGNAERLRRAISVRRSDRRPFLDVAVPAPALDRMRAAAEAAGAHLHLVNPAEVTAVVVAAGHAADVERADPAYRADLAAWVHTDDGSGTGVPPATTEPNGARTVPIRSFTGRDTDASVYDAPEVADRFARYAVVVTDHDTPRDWLAAGEALSAVLLTATAEGLATSPMSDMVEIVAARETLRRAIGNVGHPAIVVRIGVPGRGDTGPRSPRRAASDAVEIVEG